MRDKISLDVRLPLFINEKYLAELLLNIKNTINSDDILFELNTDHTNILVYKKNGAEINISNTTFSLEYSINNINLKKFIDELISEYSILKNMCKYLDTLYEFIIYASSIYKDEIRNQLVGLGVLFEEDNMKNDIDTRSFFKVRSHVKFYS